MTDLPGADDRTRVQLCGRLSIEIDGVEHAARLRGKQVPQLFAYLVLNRTRAIGRDELALALWSERAPQSQDGALRTLLSRLRSGLGEGVVRGRDELTLEFPEPVWIDFEAAAAGIQRAQEALARSDPRGAWALAQVPLNIASRGLLPGAQSEWLESARRELADIRLEALEVIGRAGLRLGPSQLGSVERAARTLIETEPYRESGYVLLMSACEAQGNVAEGLRVFERLRLLLREELGTNPSPEALEVHQRLLNPTGRRPLNGDRSARDDGMSAGSIALPPEFDVPDRSALVGREQELDSLDEWLRSTDDERVLLLAGDPGVGKTRLLAETARRAHAAGAIVLAGRSPEDTLVPYQPFLEALRHYTFNAPLDELRDVAGQHGSELARLIPELRRRLPELLPADPGDPETDRYRLFEAVAGLLGELSADAPVLVVLDDLHWADRPTLQLLRHLARSPHSARVLILGAFRLGEHAGGRTFDNELAGMRHDRVVVQLEIGGLPEREAMELVRQRVGGTPSLAYLEALYAETEGNPFFIEEIVRHLVDLGVSSHEAGATELARVALPDDVRGVISRRLGRLGEDHVQCLRVAAVIGRDFDGVLLSEVVDSSEEGLLAALEDGLAAGLVVEAPGGPGGYSFSHALVRETLYEGMTSMRRAAIHHRVGTALERADGDDQLAALALHFTRSAMTEDADRAVHYALRAAEQATAMLAHEEAADHYARALEVLARSGKDEPRVRCDLLLDLGEARMRSGERQLGWAAFHEAASLAAELGDGASLARAAIGASRRYLQPPGLVDQDLIDLLEQALAATADQRTVTRVQLLSRLCGLLYFSDRLPRMIELAEEATEIAGELGDPRAIAMAAAARRRAYWGPGGLDRRLADSTTLLQAASEAADTELALQGHAWLVLDLLELGDRTGVETQIEAFATSASELRQPLFLWNASLWRAMLALLEGRLEEAAQSAQEAVSAGIRSDSVVAPQYYAAQLMAIARERCEMDVLEPGARKLVADNPTRRVWRAGLATLFYETGRLAEAAELLAELEGDGFGTLPRDNDWMLLTSMSADIAHGVGDAGRAERLYELLLPYADVNVVIGLGAVCQGSTARFLGRLALTMGRTARAIEHLEQALAASQRLGATVWIAHTQVDLARAVGPGERRRELLAAADAIANERDLSLVQRRVRELAD